MNKDFYNKLILDAPEATQSKYLDIISFYNLTIKFLFFKYYYDEINETLYEEKINELMASYNKIIDQKLENKLSFEDFFIKIAALKENLMKDAISIYNGDPACNSISEVILIYPGFKAITSYRIAHIFYINKEYFIARTISEYAHSLTGIDINPGASIGENFFIDHGTGIVIGETCIIGNNVKLYQGVTLGALSLKDGRELKNKKRHPTIEDNVTIYSGASIFGGDTIIGKNTIIGSNVFITKSVPSNSLIKINKYNIEKITKD